MKNLLSSLIGGSAGRRDSGPTDVAREDGW